MKKSKIIAILLIVLWVKSNLLMAQEQISDGTYIPNYVLTDIEGVQHDLYHYLDSDKKILFYFTTTYDISGPAYGFWNVFPNFWDLFGPEGSDEFMVFMVEVDPETGIDDINGDTESSQMNWNAACDFPIIDSDTLNQLFNITFDKASVYVLCQNRTTINVDGLSYAKIYDKVKDCPQPKNNIDAAIGSLLIPWGVSCDDSTLPEIVLMNQGTDTLKEISIETLVDNEPVTSLMWKGSLPLYYFDTIALPEISGLSKGKHSIEVILKDPNGIADQNNENNSANAFFTNNPGKSEVNFQIFTDAYPVETEFLIYQSDSLVYSVHPLKKQNTYAMGLCLDAGSEYTMQINDAGGDGFAAGTPGYCYLIYKEDTLLKVSGDDFMYDLTKTFEVPALLTANEILTFEVPHQISTAVIDANAKTVNVEVSTKADLAVLIAKFSLSKYAVAWVADSLQVSELTANDFTLPVAYQVIAEDGTKAEWIISVSVANGISQQANRGLKLYPNPAKNTLYLSLNEKVLGVEVFNYEGKKMNILYNAANKTIDVSDLPGGVYFVSAQIENKRFYKQIMIKQ